jgi:hypothetical protein
VCLAILCVFGYAVCVWLCCVCLAMLSVFAGEREGVFVCAECWCSGVNFEGEKKRMKSQKDKNDGHGRGHGMEMEAERDTGTDMDAERDTDTDMDVAMDRMDTAQAKGGNSDNDEWEEEEVQHNLSVIPLFVLS